MSSGLCHAAVGVAGADSASTGLALAFARVRPQAPVSMTPLEMALTRLGPVPGQGPVPGFCRGPRLGWPLQGVRRDLGRGHAG